MTRLGLFRPPRVVASLHDLSCKGPGACSCRPIYVVGTEAEQDRPSSEQAPEYNGSRTDEVRESNRLREAFPAGAHPTAGAPLAYLEDETR